MTYDDSVGGLCKCIVRFVLPKARCLGKRHCVNIIIMRVYGLCVLECEYFLGVVRSHKAAAPQPLMIAQHVARVDASLGTLTSFRRVGELQASSCAVKQSSNFFRQACNEELLYSIAYAQLCNIPHDYTYPGDFGAPYQSSWNGTV